jgi:hypothetical protein
MPEATDTYGTAFKNGSVTLLARIVNGLGVNIVRTDIVAVKYFVHLLDDQNPDGRTPVTGHTDVALAVSDVIFNTLQTDAIWTVDGTGYNFRHVMDISAYQAFAVAGRRYLIEYQLSPTVGQTIVVRFRINVI